MKTSNQPTFGTHLESVRKAAGLKQEALADGLDISQTKISRLLNGAVEPTFDEVVKLAKICGVSRWTLIGGTELASKYPTECIVGLEPEASVKWVAYFASALTGLDADARASLFHDAQTVRRACEEIRAYLYEPANYTDPVRNQDLNAEYVYAIDHAQVSHTHFLVLHARQPSFGAGQELEIATNVGIPVVLLAPRGVQISRMVLGCYARLHLVHFADSRELAEGLAATFTKLATDLVDRHRGAAPLSPALQQPGENSFAGRVKVLRMSMQLDETTLARHVGLAPHAISEIEGGRHGNPSLATVRAVAQVLRTSVSYLVDGVAHNAEESDPVVRKSLDTLLQLAKDKQVPQPEFQELWDTYVLDYRTHRHAVAEARTEAVTVREWTERLRILKGGSAAKQAGLFAED